MGNKYIFINRLHKYIFKNSMTCTGKKNYKNNKWI